MSGRGSIVRRIFARRGGRRRCTALSSRGGLIFASERIFSGDSSWKRKSATSTKIGPPHCKSKEGLG